MSTETESHEFIGWYEGYHQRDAEIEALRSEVAMLRAERLILDRRIHSQRAALRKNWEIVEARAQYSRAWYPSKLLTSILSRARS